MIYNRVQQWKNFLEFLHCFKHVLFFENTIQMHSNGTAKFTSIEFFYNSSISAKLMEKSKIKNCPQWRLNPEPLDHHHNALLTELSQHLFASLS